MQYPAVSIDDQSPGDSLADLAEAIREDAVACRFVVGGAPPDPANAADFLTFLEHPRVREGFLHASQILEDRHRAYILAKTSLYRIEDIHFERTDAVELAADLTRLLHSHNASVVDAFLRDAGVRPELAKGRSRTTRLARRLAALMRRLRGQPGPTLFRSTRRWAFWVAGAVQFTAIVLDADRSHVTIVVAGWDESGVSGWWPGGVSLVPAAGEDRSVPLAVQWLETPCPAAVAFEASLLLSSPNVRCRVTQVASPSFRGPRAKVEERIVTEGLLPRLLADHRVHPDSRADGTPSAPPGTAFRKGDAVTLMQRLAVLMEEGGTFASTRIEPPAEVATTIHRMADEFYGGDASAALVYMTYDRWAAWFVGLLRVTNVIIDTRSGAVTIILLCEHD